MCVHLCVCPSVRLCVCVCVCVCVCACMCVCACAVMVLSSMLQRVLTCEWIDGCKITDVSGLERMKVDKADVCVHCSLFSKRHSWPCMSLYSHPVLLVILHHPCRCVASWWRLSVSKSFRLVLCTAILTQAMVSVCVEKGGREGRGGVYGIVARVYYLYSVYVCLI